MAEEKSAVKTRKIAGFFAQIRILFWKNGKLLIRNKLGTFAELFMAFLFIFILLAIRYFVDAKLTADDNDSEFTSNPERDLLYNATLMKGRYKIYYYPNNIFIRTKVVSAVTKIYNYNENFTALGE